MTVTVLPAVVHRPAGSGRIRMRMPYAPGNRAWLHDVLGDNLDLVWDKAEKVWKISRPHFINLVRAMAERFGAVDVFIDSRPLSRCDRRCIEAVGNECECQCNGRNHGGLLIETEQWTEVGETTLVRGGDEIYRRHFRVRRDHSVVEFLADEIFE